MAAGEWEGWDWSLISLFSPISIIIRPHNLEIYWEFALYFFDPALPWHAYMLCL